MNANVIDIINEAYTQIKDREERMGVGSFGSSTVATGAATQVALFTARPIHVPDADGGSYKTETVVYDGPGGTIKINYWSAPDPRRDPHNHPWKINDKEDELYGVSFVSYIIAGGYEETVTYKNGAQSKRSYRAGDKNVAYYDEFHTVDSVLPGTVTVMVCGPRFTPPEGASHAWGYHIDREFVPAGDPRVSDTSFFGRFVAINPHRRK